MGGGGGGGADIWLVDVGPADSWPVDIWQVTFLKGRTIGQSCFYMLFIYIIIYYFIICST